MLVPINVNVNDLLSQYNMDKRDVEDLLDYVVKEITAAFAVKWTQEAQLTLHSTRSRYIENLSVIDSGRLSGTVILDYSKDPLIRMIEEGASAFDMKEGFEKSDKVKYGKSGNWYLTIPFKLGAPDTTGDSLGGVTNLPTPVYNILKKESVDTNTGKSTGLSESQIPEQYRVPSSRAKIDIPKSATFEEYKHKSSVFKGAFKQIDSITGQSSYGSFRRVGENSDSNAFIHPGLEPANLAESSFAKFEENMGLELTRAVDNALTSLGF
jgi:hypothetical protein